MKDVIRVIVGAMMFGGGLLMLTAALIHRNELAKFIPVPLYVKHEIVTQKIMSTSPDLPKGFESYASYGTDDDYIPIAWMTAMPAFSPCKDISLDNKNEPCSYIAISDKNIGTRLSMSRWYVDAWYARQKGPDMVRKSDFIAHIEKDWKAYIHTW